MKTETYLKTIERLQKIVQQRVSVIMCAERLPWRCHRRFIAQGLVEKLKCILSLPNLFPSLARRFACCQSCSVPLRTLWASGFDSAARRALEKSKVGES